MGAILGFVLMLLPLAIALFGTWVGSSLAVYEGGPVWLAIAGSVVVGLVLPLAWELWADKDQVGGRLRDAILRSSFLSTVLVVGLLATHPETTFKALATRGDWFLGGAQGPAAEATRGVLFTLADGLEWLYGAVRERAFRDDAPEQPALVGIPVAGVAGVAAVKSAEPQAQPDARAGSAQGLKWPLSARVHPAVASMPESTKVSVAEIGAYIAARESDPMLRIKALHDFVATHVAYDVAGLKDGSYKARGRQSPAVVLETGRAVCAGYAKLMVALGEVTGDDIRYVVGDSRNAGDYAELVSTEALPAEDAGHAWNAVSVQGRWYLLDTTWDAGTVGPSGFKARYKTDYLFTPPQVFLVRHLPDDARMQLVDTHLSRAQWLRQPLIQPLAFRLGVTLRTPRRPMLRANDSLVVSLNNPHGAKVMGAVYGLDGGESLSKCDVNGAGTQVSCSIPDDRVRAVVFLGAPGSNKGTSAMSFIVDG